MPNVLTEKEVDDLLDALAGAPVVSFAREEKMVNINIIRKGIYPIPQEAKKCPVCGKYEQFYRLEDKYEVPHLRCRQAVIDKDYYVQKYPTFTCDECQTIWQYLGEKEEEKE